MPKTRVTEKTVRHTPGPWRRVIGRGMKTICRIHGGAENVMETEVAVLYPTAAPEQLANAQLICAAPELLAACRGALDPFSVWEGPEEEEQAGQYALPSRARNEAVRAYEAIRAAIAKAEGKAQ